MIRKFIRPFILLIASVIFISCSEEKDTSTNPTDSEPETIEFYKVFDQSDVPDNIKRNSIVDAAVLSENTYLVVVDGKLFKVQEGVPELLLNNEFGTILGVSTTSNGNIYCIGRHPDVNDWETVYYSTDGGSSFGYVTKPLLDEGVSLIRGLPNQIMVRKLNDGSYLMILKVEYTSTGVGYKLYQDYYFESNNGINWIYREDTGTTSQHFEPVSIDNNGIIFYNVKELNEFNGIDNILYRSDDKGRTVKRVENARIPNGINYNGKLWSIQRIESDYEDTWFYGWNGSKWINYQGEGFERLIAEPKVDFTTTNKIVLITPFSIYKQK